MDSRELRKIENYYLAKNYRKQEGSFLGSLEIYARNPILSFFGG